MCMTKRERGQNGQTVLLVVDFTRIFEKKVKCSCICLGDVDQPLPASHVDWTLLLLELSMAGVQGGHTSSWTPGPCEQPWALNDPPLPILCPPPFISFSSPPVSRLPGRCRRWQADLRLLPFPTPTKGKASAPLLCRIFPQSFPPCSV